jgi:hypothetical protein
MESQNHLRDAVDRQYIEEETHAVLNALAEAALRAVTGLMEYLQSAEALQNARRARERRIAMRLERRSNAAGPDETVNAAAPDEPRTGTPEPRTRNRT